MMVFEERKEEMKTQAERNKETYMQTEEGKHQE